MPTFYVCIPCVSGVLFPCFHSARKQLEEKERKSGDAVASMKREMERYDDIATKWEV